ncbi:MAG: hypothetical protein Q9174_004308 [Haloplaca sp. 1 TL-2023]
MAAGTRHQAEMQGLNENDMVSLEDSGEAKAEALTREDVRKGFEQLIDCYPVFCLTQNISLSVSIPAMTPALLPQPDRPPKPNKPAREQGYFPLLILYCHGTESLRKPTTHNTADQPILEITSTAPDDAALLNQCKLNYLDIDASKPMPFVGASIQECYNFFNTRLSRLNSPSFARYTFLAIDDACLVAEPQELIVGTDAADFGEKPGDPPILKVIRQSVNDIMEALTRLETHTTTPSEIETRAEMCVSVVPHPMMVLPGSATDGMSVRDAKRQAIWGVPGPVERERMAKERKEGTHEDQGGEDVKMEE